MMLGVSTRTIRNWEREGKIACQKTIGGHRRVWLSDIKRLQGVLLAKGKPAEEPKTADDG